MFALALLLGACTGDDDSAKNDQRLGFGPPESATSTAAASTTTAASAATTTAPPELATDAADPDFDTAGVFVRQGPWWCDAGRVTVATRSPPPARPAQSERATTSEPNDEDRQEIRGSRRRPSPRWPRESVLWSSRQTEHTRRQASANPVSIAARFSAAKGPAPAAMPPPIALAGSSPR